MRQLFLLTAALAPLSASGQDFGPLRWDYVAAGVVLPELDEIGVEIEGSIAVTPDLVVFGGYRDFEPGGRAGRETVSISVGRRFGVRPNIDVLASIGYGDNELETPGRNRDEEGLILGGRIRGWATRRLELNGAILLDNSVGSNTETVLEIGGQIFRGANWSYGGRLRVDDNDEALFLGIRAYFGPSRR